jgi:hypothetical protein
MLYVSWVSLRAAKDISTAFAKAMELLLGSAHPLGKNSTCTRYGEAVIAKMVSARVALNRRHNRPSCRPLTCRGACDSAMAPRLAPRGASSGEDMPL